MRPAPNSIDFNPFLTLFSHLYYGSSSHFNHQLHFSWGKKKLTVAKTSHSPFIINITTFILASKQIAPIMGRSPCCDKINLKKGPWTTEEDLKLIQYIQMHGPSNWRTLPKNAGKLCFQICTFPFW